MHPLAAQEGAVRVGYIIGTDEAGYGPNLGPLVISATVWRVPGEPRAADLPTLLKSLVTQKLPTTPRRSTATTKPAFPRRISIADSKQLYSPARGLSLLEANLLAMLAVCGKTPRSWRRILAELDPLVHEDLATVPWYADYEAPLPVATCPDWLATLCERLCQRAVKLHEVELIEVQARVILPARFNNLVQKLGTKGAALTQLTLDLLARLLPLLGDEPVWIVCDKHGGRNRYAGQLQHSFPEQLVRVLEEGRAASSYQLQGSRSSCEICFRTRAEEAIPAALASMTAKYLRELTMKAFNEFWCREIPQLKPTAGYPLDARRFRQDIGQRQQALGIDDALLWRDR